MGVWQIEVITLTNKDLKNKYFSSIPTFLHNKGSKNAFMNLVRQMAFVTLSYQPPQLLCRAKNFFTKVSAKKFKIYAQGRFTIQNGFISSNLTKTISYSLE